MEIKYWKCGLCEREYDTKEEIKGDVSVRNGDDFLVKPDVCRSCLRKSINFFRENFKGARKEVLPEVELVKSKA